MLAAPAAAAQTPAVASSVSRRIAALSAAQEAELLDGRGMGLAKAAEGNGWPGPMDVLELAGPPLLSREQRRLADDLHQCTGGRARAIGTELVAAERALDGLFHGRTIDTSASRTATVHIGLPQGALREVQLTPRLEPTALLTEAQIASYNRLRGITGQAGEGVWPMHHDHR